MKWQFVKQIPELSDSGVTNTPFVKILCPQTNLLSVCSHMNITCLNVDLLSIGEDFSVSLKNCILVAYNKLLFHERSDKFNTSHLEACLVLSF
jgi:hypothetical protein